MWCLWCSEVSVLGQSKIILDIFDIYLIYLIYKYNVIDACQGHERAGNRPGHANVCHSVKEHASVMVYDTQCWDQANPSYLVMNSTVCVFDNQNMA